MQLLNLKVEIFYSKEFDINLFSSSPCTVYYCFPGHSRDYESNEIILSIRSTIFRAIENLIPPAGITPGHTGVFVDERRINMHEYTQYYRTILYDNGINPVMIFNNALILFGNLYYNELNIKENIVCCDKNKGKIFSNISIN